MTVNTDRYPLWESLVQPSRYGRPEVHGIGCEGNRVHFADGTSALDVMSGLWNANLGYGNKAVTEAITDCLNTASYLPLFRGGHRLAEQAARAVLDVSGPDHFGRVLFSTSGGAANDVMMKLVRHYQALRGDEDRDVVVGLRNSWHGLTYGSFALTGQPLGQDVYRVDRSKVRHVSHEDVTELVELLAREGDKIAAVILEPVLGTGAHPVSDELLGAMEELRAQHGFLVVADEVATGFGRTGSYFASQNWPFKPDVMITSKGLTNGTCAASAIVVSHDVCEMFERTDAVLFHGETQAYFAHQLRRHHRHHRRDGAPRRGHPGPEAHPEAGRPPGGDLLPPAGRRNPRPRLLPRHPAVRALRRTHRGGPCGTA